MDFSIRNMLKRIIFIGFLVQTFAWCQPAKMTFLILPFENSTGRPELNSLTTGVPDLLTSDLTVSSEGIQVVEREKLDAIMAEQSLKWENVMKDKAYGRLGRLAQAQYI